MKALFVCDEKDLWTYYRNLFASHFTKLEVVFCIHGDEAIEKIGSEESFSLFLIEAGLKNEEPSQIAQNIIDLAGERPIIFVGEKVHISSRIDEQLIEESEVNEILIKPFDIHSFKKIVKAGLDWVRKEEFEQSIIEIDKEELLPMRIRNFYLYNTIPYDAYLELTQTKFAKVLTKDKKYVQAEISNFSKRGVKHLYLFKDDFLKLLEEGMKRILFILKQKNKQTPKILIATQIKGVLLAHQYIQKVGVTKELNLLCKELIETTNIVFRQYGKMKTLLVDFPFNNFDTSEQAVFTAYLCEAMLVGLGWASDTSRKKLGLASILYDSMLTNEDLSKIRSLDDRNLAMFTEQEQEEFRLHPAKAAQMARHFQGYSEVDFIIAQHHERPRGDGFPAKLTSNKLTAHSCAFILATAFTTRLAMSNGEQGNLIKIFREIKTLYNVGNFKEPLNSLQRTLF
ncbi:hypothetical protein HBN50_02700 [Halobacteriovorax sp. GB3]|uniref:HD domain-containing phosphohydrolase n=1 Tax=Halobacteriovorax sp. GB3 TaxID=2719615 RepID=UPI00235FACA1|nr:HD domain-containing phosphohydrolase [Halobacteriovorax sp. GB3]MDD0851984.1 hypothetical protein [Halobacteriovorax sp. GB3]